MAASLGIVAAIVALIVGLVTVISESGAFSAGSPAPLSQGAPGSPVPLESTDCADPCFGSDHLGEARLNAEDFARMGTTSVLDPEGWYSDTSPSEQYEQTIDYWRESSLTPDECMFTATETPTIVVVGGSPTAEDDIAWLTSFESETGGSTAVRALRFFETADDAATHLEQLHDLVSQCTQYGVQGFGGWTTTVTPMPALEVPPTVAAVGWVETIAGFGRYYAVDVLRSNAVIRLTVYTDNTVSESAFRTLAHTMADDLAGWPLEVSGDWGTEGRPDVGFQPDGDEPLSGRELCRDECFTTEQALALAPTSTDVTALGLTQAGSADPFGSTAGAALDARQLVETTNAQCRFALGIEPVVRGNPAAFSGARLDELVDLGRYERSGVSIRVVARVFENANRAEAYAAATGYALNLCGQQTLGTPQGEVLVTMLPAQITGYDSVDDPIVADRTTTHIGWQHDGGRTDRGHDLQHGNIVVRVVVEASPSDQLSEREVARLLLPMIERLEALEPVD